MSYISTIVGRQARYPENFELGQALRRVAFAAHVLPALEAALPPLPDADAGEGDSYFSRSVREGFWCSLPEETETVGWQRGRSWEFRCLACRPGAPAAGDWWTVGRGELLRLGLPSYQPPFCRACGHLLTALSARVPEAAPTA